MATHILSIQRLALTALFFLATIFQSSSLQAIDFQDCVKCHSEVLDKDITQDYLHSPFSENNCAGCHTAKISAPLQKMFDRMGLPVKRYIEREVSWVSDSNAKTDNHGFRLPSSVLGDTLIVELNWIDDKPSLHEIDIPPMTSLSEVEDS